METWEIEISALLDGELEPDRVLPLFDAMARDAELRQFYVQARALEGVILSTGAAAETEPAPAGLWSRIRADVGEAGPDRDGPRWRAPRIGRIPRMVRVPAWTLGAAAAVMVAILAWRAAPDLPARLRIGPGAAALVGEPIEVTVGTHPEAMDDRRFVELTAQLLEADPRYQRKMLQVMEEIQEAGIFPEATSESRRRTEWDDDGAGADAVTP